MAIAAAPFYSLRQKKEPREAVEKGRSSRDWLPSCYSHIAVAMVPAGLEEKKETEQKTRTRRRRKKKNYDERKICRTPSARTAVLTGIILIINQREV